MCFRQPSSACTFLTLFSTSMNLQKWSETLASAWLWKLQALMTGKGNQCFVKARNWPCTILLAIIAYHPSQLVGNRPWCVLYILILEMCIRAINVLCSFLPTISTPKSAIPKLRCPTCTFWLGNVTSTATNGLMHFFCTPLKFQLDKRGPNFPPKIYVSILHVTSCSHVHLEMCFAPHTACNFSSLPVARSTRKWSPQGCQDFSEPTFRQQLAKESQQRLSMQSHKDRVQVSVCTSLTASRNSRICRLSLSKIVDTILSVVLWSLKWKMMISEWFPKASQVPLALKCLAFVSLHIVGMFDF